MGQWDGGEMLDGRPGRFWGPCGGGPHGGVRAEGVCGRATAWGGTQTRGGPRGWGPGDGSQGTLSVETWGCTEGSLGCTCYCT